MSVTDFSSIPPSWATNQNYVAPGKSWNGSATIIEPTAAQKAAGLSPQDRPPAQWINWQLNQLGNYAEIVHQLPACGWRVQSVNASAPVQDIIDLAYNDTTERYTAVLSNTSGTASAYQARNIAAITSGADWPTGNENAAWRNVYAITQREGNGSYVYALASDGTNTFVLISTNGGAAYTSTNTTLASPGSGTKVTGAYDSVNDCVCFFLWVGGGLVPTIIRIQCYSGTITYPTTPNTLNTNYGRGSIAAAPGRLVISASQGSGGWYFMQSVNGGISWTAPTLTQITGHFYDILVNATYSTAHNAWFALFYSTSAQTFGVMRSIDGITWAIVQAAVAGVVQKAAPGNQSNLAIRGGMLFFVAETDSATHMVSLCYSFDGGVTWARKALASTSNPTGEYRAYAPPWGSRGRCLLSWPHFQIAIGPDLYA